jgi:flavin reductase (DIM6/NTAB) family NADH-FMN oxidoreductase RutF
MFYETSGPHGLPHDPFKSCVVPRPIGWISTLSREGVANLAPFSFFNGVGANPPQVMYHCGSQHAEGGPKDSLKNVIETGEFVFNMATWELHEQMNTTSLHLARNVDEFAAAGLAIEPSQLVSPPRVAASPIHLECTLVKTVDLLSNDPDDYNTIVCGHVIGVHIKDEVLTDGMVDMSKLRPIARLGYMDYTVIDNVFTMPFPDASPVAREP